MDLERLLTPKEAAELLSVTEGCLKRWRMTGDGPAWYKLGDGAKSPVRYKRSDLETFIATGKR